MRVSRERQREKHKFVGVPEKTHPNQGKDLHSKLVLRPSELARKVLRVFALREAHVVLFSLDWFVNGTATTCRPFILLLSLCFVACQSCVSADWQDPVYGLVLGKPNKGCLNHTVDGQNNSVPPKKPVNE